MQSDWLIGFIDSLSYIAVKSRKSEAGEVQPRCITYIQGDTRRVTASSHLLTGTNGGDVPSSVRAIFGFNE